MEEDKMVKTQDEDKELLTIKQNNEIELLKIKEELNINDHKRKIERLNLQLEIAKASGSLKEED